MVILNLVRKLHQIPFKSSDSNIINGKNIAQNILEEVTSTIDKLVNKPFLAVVLLGDDPASAIYIRAKTKAARTVGIQTETYRYPASTTQQELLTLLDKLNSNSSVNGILVQRPLPEHIDEAVICNSVHPSKDVDGYNPQNLGRYCTHQPAITPCTALAVNEIIKRTGVAVFGKKAVICGRSKTVGLPIALHLLKEHATTTIVHKYSQQIDMVDYLRSADIIVSAVGVPGLISKDMVKPGACVIDVGFTRVRDPTTRHERVVGDCDFNSVKQVAGYITPVPGGVGPVTVAMLMKNTLFALQFQNS